MLSNFTPIQGAKVTQLNLAAALILDQDVIPPTITLSLNPSTIPANGVATSVATATVLDNNGNPLTGETVTFSTSGDVGISEVTPHPDGTYTVTLTASTTLGEETITATDSGVSASAILVETLYCPGTCITDTTSSDFAGGTTGSSVYVSETTDGEIILAPTVGTEFSGTTLPASWTALAHTCGGPFVTVINGWMTLDCGQVYTSDPTFYTAGRSLEFYGLLGGGLHQAGGFAVNATTESWAVFDYANDATTLAAWTSSGTATTISGSWTTTPHLYRIEWGTADIKYYVDGVLRATTGTVTGSMRPIFTDTIVAGQVNQVDWVRMSPYASAGTFYSRVLMRVDPPIGGSPTGLPRHPPEQVLSSACARGTHQLRTVPGAVSLRSPMGHQLACKVSTCSTGPSCPHPIAM